MIQKKTSLYRNFNEKLVYLFFKSQVLSKANFFAISVFETIRNIRALLFILLVRFPVVKIPELESLQYECAIALNVEI